MEAELKRIEDEGSIDLDTFGLPTGPAAAPGTADVENASTEEEGAA